MCALPFFPSLPSTATHPSGGLPQRLPTRFSADACVKPGKFLGKYNGVEPMRTMYFAPEVDKRARELIKENRSEVCIRSGCALAQIQHTYRVPRSLPRTRGAAQICAVSRGR